MTQQEIITAIAASVADKPSAQAIATVELNKAIAKMGRMNGVNFNRETIEVTLTANKNVYTFGADAGFVLSSGTDIINVNNIWVMTGSTGKIPMVSDDKFSSVKSGQSTQTGCPVVATYHSSRKVLEFFPIPDSGYKIRMQVQKTITGLTQIPDYYHDVIIDYARASVHAAQNGEVAVSFAKAGLDDLRKNPLTGWDGDVIGLGPGFGDIRGMVGRADSFNLNGR